MRRWVPRAAVALLTAMTAARATAQVPRPSVLPAGRLLDNDCPSTVVLWWQRLANGGRIACAHDPTRPAILLVHGLHQNINTWTAPSTVGYAYDVSRDPGPERIGDSHQDPGVGVYKVGTSPWLYGNDPAAWDREHNWFDYLVSLGFTVAAWSQPGTSFQDAVPTALAAFDSLVAQTKARSPRTPPPIALIGHSRGGLVIRRILKERRSSGDIGRVKWVVTLHSPHQGSLLGEYPGRLVAETIDLMDCCAPPSLTAPLKTQLKNAVTEAMRPMTKILVDFESRELTPGSPMLRDLASGETAVPGVKYYTFGGVNPTLYRLYVWTFGQQRRAAVQGPEPVLRLAREPNGAVAGLARARQDPALSARGAGRLWRWLGDRRERAIAVVDARHGPSQSRPSAVRPAAADAGGSTDREEVS